MTWSVLGIIIAIGIMPCWPKHGLLNRSPWPKDHPYITTAYFWTSSDPPIKPYVSLNSTEHQQNSFQNWTSFVVWTCHQKFINSKGSQIRVQLSFTTFWTSYTLSLFRRNEKITRISLTKCEFLKRCQERFW